MRDESPDTGKGGGDGPERHDRGLCQASESLRQGGRQAGRLHVGQQQSDAEGADERAGVSGSFRAHGPGELRHPAGPERDGPSAPAFGQAAGKAVRQLFRRDSHPARGADGGDPGPQRRGDRQLQQPGRGLDGNPDQGGEEVLQRIDGGLLSSL